MSSPRPSQDRIRRPPGPWPWRALACAALLLASGCGGEAPAEGPPNVILISIDTLRADHLSCYGYERPTSPRLDALAAQGTRFENAYSSSSWTLPAHMTLFTGLPVSGHGICDDRIFTRATPDGSAAPVPQRGRLLSQQFAEGGYRTGGFYTWKYLSPEFGFGPGFDVYERFNHTHYSIEEVWEEFQRIREARDKAAFEDLAARHPDLFDPTTPSSEQVVDRGIEWIEDVRRDTPERPFFAFLHLFDVHDPYTPPAPFDERFDPGYEGPIDGTRVSAKNSLVTANMAEEDLRHLVALYDGEIAWVDSQLGRLFDRLDELGLADDTIVAVVSDHGEEFYEHGTKTHRNNVHVESVHVPWILRWPARLEAGRVVPQSVGLQDVGPTLLGLAGLEPLPGASGVDFAPALRGEEPFVDREVWSEHYHFEHGAPPTRELALRHGGRAWIAGARGERTDAIERYDLTRDPGEQDARVLAEDAEAVEPYHLALDALRARLSATRPRLPIAWIGGPDASLDEADLAELEAMGYTGAGEVHAGRDGSVDRLCVDGCVWED